MKFSLIYLIIASAVSTANFNIYDIEYNKRFVLDPHEFPSNKIPIGTYYFRISVENLSSSFIKILFKKDNAANFKVNISPYMNIKLIQKFLMQLII